MIDNHQRATSKFHKPTHVQFEYVAEIVKVVLLKIQVLWAVKAKPISKELLLFHGTIVSSKHQ